MSFFTSLSGLRAAQTDLSVTANNVSNSGALGFKKSTAVFGDLFSSAPTQTTKTVAGQGTRLIGVVQQFSQGSLRPTDRTLDLAVAGEGMFVVKSPPPANVESYTRNGAFSVDQNRNVVDTLGNSAQLLPVDATTGQVTSTNRADMVNFVLPQIDPNDANAALVSVDINDSGLVTATYANGNQSKLGAVALAAFPAIEGLRPEGDAHWTATGDSGAARIGSARTQEFGNVRSGTLENSNVDLTEELVSLITAQRNFQANAQAIETANNMTQTIINLQV